jgi:manganese/iron transport system ATP-binding protein
MQKTARHSGYRGHRFSPHGIVTPALKITELGYIYDHLVALENLNCEIQLGERLAVVGPNGAGKSTLFKIIAGVLKPSHGIVSVYGHAPGGHSCIAYVPQRSQVDWNFPVNVSDVVMMGRTSKIGPLHWPSKADREIIQHALEVVGMDRLAKNGIDQLSGGQQQRVFIARALAQEAELILMDEPLTGLDQATQDDIFHILDELRHQNVTVMVALHDLKIAAERFDRILMLNRRLIGLGKPEEVLIPERLAQAYGEHLRLVPTPEGVIVLEDTCCNGEGDSHA